MAPNFCRLIAILSLWCTGAASGAEPPAGLLKFGITAVILQDQGEFLAVGWPRAVASPRLPQIRTCPIRASGSSD